MPIFLPPTILAGQTFLPNNVPNLHSWFRSDMGVTIGTGVSQWADQSGNARNVTQATGSAQPTYNGSNGPNSLPTLFFDGSDDELASSFTALSQPFHVFVLMKHVTTSGAAGIITGSSSSERIGDAQSGWFTFFGGTGISRSPAFTDTANFHIWEVLTNGASSSLLYDNQAANTGSVGSNTLSGLKFAGSVSSRASFYICELCLYSSQVTGTNLTNLRAYFASRYGVLTN